MSVVVRGAHLEAIQRDGLHVHDAVTGRTTIARPRADSNPVRLGAQEAVLVTVKGHSLPEVARTIGPLLGPKTSILTAMNGVPWWFFDRLPGPCRGWRLESLDPEGLLARTMPTERLVGCVVHLAASRAAPGRISLNRGRRLIVGEPGGGDGERVRSIAEALSGAGFEVQLSPAIERDYWVKLLGNVSFNPVSALTLATADQLIADAAIKAYMVAVMRECLAIGRAAGIEADIDPEARIDMARELGPFKTSMLQDLEAGKPLEIAALLGATLEIAQKTGVPAPYTESLFALIRLRARAAGLYP